MCGCVCVFVRACVRACMRARARLVVPLYADAVSMHCSVDRDFPLSRGLTTGPC